MALILSQWRGEHSRAHASRTVGSLGAYKTMRNKGVRILISSSCIVSKTIIDWRQVTTEM